MRCLALAHSVRTWGGGSVCLWSGTGPVSRPAPKPRRRGSARAVRGRIQADAEYLGDVAVGTQADWIVVDGYQFGPDYQAALDTPHAGCFA